MDRATALRVLGLDARREPDEAAIEGAYWRLRAHLELRLEEARTPDERRARQAELAQLQAALQQSPVAPPPEPPAAESPRLPLPRWLLGWAIAASGVALLLGVAVIWLATRPVPDFAAPGLVGGGAAGPTGPAGDGGALASAATGPESSGGAGGAPADAGDPSAAPGGPAVNAPGGPAVNAPGGPAVNGARSASAGPPQEPAFLIAKANLEGSRLIIRRSGDGAGVFEGPADATEHELPPGRYVLQVSNPECSDRWESEVALSPGERRQVDPRNCERNGWLVVRSNVSGDVVSIDARRVGSSGTQRHAVSVGEHRILVQKEGYVPWEGVTRVAPAEVVTLRAQLFEAADLADAGAAGAESEQSPSQRRLDGLWHIETQKWLLARYDRDLSGRIDTPAEVRAIACRDLLDIEGSFDRAELGMPLTRSFGFDGSGWVDGALGFDRAVRDVAYARMQDCGLR